MKNNLLTSLKTKYKNLGFGDKAFDGVAEFLSKTVTKEDEIETAISGVEPLLKAFQGDNDKIRNEKAELQRKLAELEKKHSGQDEPNPPNPGDQSDIRKIISEAIKEAVTPLQQKIEGYETKDRQASLLSKAKSKLSEKKIPEKYWSKRNLNIESDEQVDAHCY